MSKDRKKGKRSFDVLEKVEKKTDNSLTDRLGMSPEYFAEEKTRLEEEVDKYETAMNQAMYDMQQANFEVGKVEEKLKEVESEYLRESYLQMHSRVTIKHDQLRSRYGDLSGIYVSACAELEDFVGDEK